MIEIIYREDDNSSEEISVKLPKNIQQVGDTKGTKKIYFEELVIETVKEKARYGVLLGKAKHVGNSTYLFVNGAVFAPNDGKNVVFNDRVWTGIYEEIHDYFSGAEIVGWFVSENNKQLSLAAVKKIQLDNFPGNDRICMLSDISENENQVYYYNNGEMECINGYYVYFEKNMEFEKYLVRSKALEELFVPEEGQEGTEAPKPAETAFSKQEKPELPGEKKWNIKGMIPSYTVVALLLAAIVVMNNYGQISSIKSSLAAIAGELIHNPTTEAAGEVKPVVEDLPGQVDTTREETSQNKSTEKNTETKKENPEESTTKEKTTKKQSTEEKATKKEKTTKKEKATGEESTTEKPADAEPMPKVRYYTVKKGETLSAISKKMYNDISMVEKIMKANKIKDANMIYEGQKIVLP